MSTSTLPKSLQTLNNETDTGIDRATRLRQCREFVDRYQQLPPDFLRIPGHLNETTSPARVIIPETAPLVHMIEVSVVEAQLVKNYGLLRMDLYCKIRVGHMVCETQTCQNGAKNPKWDGVYQFNLYPGIDSFHLEIYDEKQFSPDEKIAWLYEPIPPEIFQGITLERWFPLSGRSGQNKEGSILLVLSHKRERVPIRGSSCRAIIPHPQHPVLTHVIPGPAASTIYTNPPMEGYRIPEYVQPPTMPPPPGAVAVNVPGPEVGARVAQVRQANEEDVNQLSEMFPAIDKNIIKAVLENNNHDKEASIGALLAMG